ncbi:hypothetical protein OpiT1DRAFT_05365 [Opitutaceae bacterium TAV1]|nr:hypothetical protein OpiT1DRAFT_05365 [Opitutaceae bacterium TAV1]
MKNNSETTARTSRELLDDLHTLVAEVEKLTGDSASEPAADTLEALRARFTAAQERLTDLCACTKKKIVAGAHCADEAIRAKPYQALAIAAGVGLFIGFLAGRRSKSAD